MSNIAKSGARYAYIAPPGVEQRADGAEQALGRERPGARRPAAQPHDAVQCAEEASPRRATNILAPTVGLEYQRGLQNADKIRLASVDAYRAAANAAARHGGPSPSAPASTRSGALLLELDREHPQGAALAATASGRYARPHHEHLHGPRTQTDKPIHIAGGYNPDPKADPFDRDTRTLFGARNGVSLDVAKAALAAQEVGIPVTTTDRRQDRDDHLSSRRRS